MIQENCIAIFHLLVVDQHQKNKKTTTAETTTTTAAQKCNLSFEQKKTI
jgi:hypothetical protein